MDDLFSSEGLIYNKNLDIRGFDNRSFNNRSFDNRSSIIEVKSLYITL